MSDDQHGGPVPLADSSDDGRASTTSPDEGAAPAAAAPDEGRRVSDSASPPDDDGKPETGSDDDHGKKSPLQTLGHLLREIAIVVVVALVASALLRAFVVQAFFVPSGSMLPEIQKDDRILVSRIGGIDRGEVVVFEDPGNWIPSSEEAPPSTGIRKGLEWIGVLPASGHEHLVKRVIGLPGDHVICCKQGKLTINGVAVDESDFLFQGAKKADNYTFDVVVPADRIFVLGDHRYDSGDSSRKISCDDPKAGFVSTDLVTGRAFAVIWPRSNAHIMHIPDAYDDVPAGDDPPAEGVVNMLNGQDCSGSGAP